MTVNAYGLSALGIICPLGDSPQAVWQQWLAGSEQGMVVDEQLIPERPTVVGRVSVPLPALIHGEPRWASRNLQLLEHAAAQIAGEVAAMVARYGSERVAVIIGASTSGIADGEQALLEHHQHGRFISPFDYAAQEMGTPARYLQARFGLSGPAYCISTACSSSGKAFASAQRLLDGGQIDAAVIGGVDSLCGLTLNGFHALESVSAGHCRPFGDGRDGINIGEGAALFVISRQPAAINLYGVGEATDAYHVSAPHPEGLGAEAAMRGALARAGLAPAAIGYLNLHGTATPLNDQMESKAVARVFGDELACASTKRQTGHCLGAAGAIENALCWLALSDLNGDGLLPAMSGDYPLDDSLTPIGLLRRPGRWPTGPRYSLSNSFAFGGSNVAVCLGREQP